MSHQVAGSPSERAIVAARRLDAWAQRSDWRGSDPYDALNARRLAPRLPDHPLGLRLLTQAVKRSPLDLRPILGIPPGLSAATLALAASAYARGGWLPRTDARRHLDRCVERLEQLRCAGFGQPCWGYHFDVQTRVFFYPRTQPNTIATAFAGLGLLDAHEFGEHPRALELAVGAGEFFLQHVPQTKSAPGAYFGYLPGDSTPIHNASMLIAALLARLAAQTGRDDFGTAASAALDYTVSRQRPAGSWPYGEREGLEWVDGFHSGYVLDCLLTCVESGIGGSGAEEAWRRGVGFYADALVEPDGTPRYTPESRYPVDSQCAAQAIETLSRAASRLPELAERRWAAFDYSMRRLALPSGAFAFQRERWWTNRAAHPRWVQAPMLKALSWLIRSDEPSQTRSSSVAEALTDAR